MSKILGTLVGFMLLIACVVIIFGVMNRNATEQSVEAPSSLEVVQTSTDWKTVFSENGFTDDETASYDEILTS